jgi:hypothetical protein
MTYDYYQGLIKERIGKLALLSIALLFALTATIGIFQSSRAASAVVWNQDFSENTAGWTDFRGTISHNLDEGTATVKGNQWNCPQFVQDWGIGPCYGGAFSAFDSYRSDWPGDYTAELDIYLDPETEDLQDERWGFDYIVASNGTDGLHLRDFVFHVGLVEGSLLVNGSNNADFYTNEYKLLNDNDKQYYPVIEAGWYTFQHFFYDDGGFLAVDLNLLDENGGLLWSATRATTDDIDSVVGGNRYAWFSHVDAENGIEIDNHRLLVGEEVAPPEAPVLVSPANNSVVNATSPIANTWAAVDDAAHYTYQSYNVDSSGNCNLNSVRWTEDYTENQTNSRTIADGLTFCWRVTATNGQGVESEWSNLWKVTIDNIAPVATIIAPDDEAEVSGLVTLVGEVTDANPKNSYFRIEGPNGYLADDLFTNGRQLHEYDWDTTEVEDGEYTVYFEARDKAGNKDGTRSNPSDSVDVIKVVVNNAPTNKEECKNGGWMGYYRNEGFCVSSFATRNAQGNALGNRR